MIIMNSAELRSLAEALDGLADVERQTGVLIEGHGGNTLTTTSADTVRFARRTEPGDGEATLVEYVVEIEG